VSTALDVATSVLFVLGTAFALTAAIGLHRLPDVFARMHAATKPATLGAVCTLTGAALQVGDWEAVTKLLLAVVLQLMSAPVGAHVLARAAHDAGAPQSPHTVVDECD
jgi:multicomponent Na+:H+ antiporter subunit G